MATGHRHKIGGPSKVSPNFALMSLVFLRRNRSAGRPMNTTPRKSGAKFKTNSGQGKEGYSKPEDPFRDRRGHQIRNAGSEIRNYY
jgi:hypothetical protein